MSYTPFGIVAVDGERTIFRLVPISAKLRDETRFVQTRPAPVLQDRQAKKFTFSLSESVTRQQLLQALQCDELSDAPTTVAELTLPGMKLQLGTVTIRCEDNRIIFTLSEPPSDSSR